LQAKRDIDQKATSVRDVESTATQRGWPIGNRQVYIQFIGLLQTRRRIFCILPSRGDDTRCEL